MLGIKSLVRELQGHLPARGVSGCVSGRDKADDRQAGRGKSVGTGPVPKRRRTGCAAGRHAVQRRLSINRRRIRYRELPLHGHRLDPRCSAARPADGPGFTQLAFFEAPDETALSQRGESLQRQMPAPFTRSLTLQTNARFCSSAGARISKSRRAPATSQHDGRRHGAILTRRSGLDGIQGAT